MVRLTGEERAVDEDARGCATLAPGRAHGDTPVANGTRVVVKVDGSARPVPWTDSFRALFGWLADGAKGPRP